MSFSSLAGPARGSLLRPRAAWVTVPNVPDKGPVMKQPICWPKAVSSQASILAAVALFSKGFLRARLSRCRRLPPKDRKRGRGQFTHNWRYGDPVGSAKGSEGRTGVALASGTPAAEPQPHVAGPRANIALK